MDYPEELPAYLRPCFGQDPEKCTSKCETCDWAGPCEGAWEDADKALKEVE
jgi:hypothetical protein